LPHRDENAWHKCGHFWSWKLGPGFVLSAQVFLSRRSRWQAVYSHWRNQGHKFVKKNLANVSSDLTFKLFFRGGGEQHFSLYFQLVENAKNVLLNTIGESDVTSGKGFKNFNSMKWKRTKRMIIWIRKYWKTHLIGGRNKCSKCTYTSLQKTV